MKKTLITLLALAGAAGATTSTTEIITFSTGDGTAGDYKYGVNFGTDSFNTHNKYNPTFTTDAEKVSVKVSSSASNVYTTYTSYADPSKPAEYWSNSKALSEMNATLGTSLTLANLDAAPLAYGGGGGAKGTLTLTFGNDCSAGETFVGYLLVGAFASTPSSLTLSGLAEGYTVQYATAQGSGFNDTPTFTAGTHYTTLVKITGAFADKNTSVSVTVDGNNTDHKTGFAMAAYKVIPEPTTATLSLLALAGLAARRRRATR